MLFSEDNPFDFVVQAIEFGVKHGWGRREQGIGNREQGTGNRGQGTGNGERGTGNRENTPLTSPTEGRNQLGLLVTVLFFDNFLPF
jgi:hypothetical protein